MKGNKEYLKKGLHDFRNFHQRKSALRSLMFVIVGKKHEILAFILAKEMS
jgi:hypothetical protein